MKLPAWLTFKRNGQANTAAVPGNGRGLFSPRRRGAGAGILGGIKSDYAAGKTSRFRRSAAGVNPMGSGGDYHYRTEAGFLRMLELARAIDRNNPVLGQGVDRVIDNVLQDGMRLDPQNDLKSANPVLSRKWEEWSSDPTACDQGGQFNLHELARLVLRAKFIDGDILVLLTEDRTIQLVEAHRLRTPQDMRTKVVHGVQLDRFRRPVIYWITKDDINPNQVVQKASGAAPYAAWDSEGNRQVLHIKSPKRVSQTRGVTALAPIVDTLVMFDDIQFAKMVQQQVASCFAVLRTRAADDFGVGVDKQFGPQTAETMSDGVSRTLEGISPGMMIDGLDGETLQGFSPNIPNPEYFKQSWMLLQQVAANIGIPAHVLLLDPSQTNFSGWRGAIDQARMGFRQIQQWMIAHFYTPIYLWRVRDWKRFDPLLAKLDVNGTGRLEKHRFNAPSWKYIEPKKDAEADRVRLDNRLISQSRYQAERGRDWDDLALEIPRDNARLVMAAIDEADKINAKNPDAKVDWRELARFDLKGRPSSGASSQQRKPVEVSTDADN